MLNEIQNPTAPHQRVHLLAFPTSSEFGRVHHLTIWMCVVVGRVEGKGCLVSRTQGAAVQWPSSVHDFRYLINTQRAAQYTLLLLSFSTHPADAQISRSIIPHNCDLGNRCLRDRTSSKIFFRYCRPFTTPTPATPVLLLPIPLSPCSVSFALRHSFRRDINIRSLAVFPSDSKDCQLPIRTSCTVP